MVTESLYLLFVTVIALLALLVGFWQLRVSGKMGRELEKLSQQLLEIEAKEKIKPSFSNSLDQIERDQKLTSIPRSSSEKYRYISSLADQGVDIGGIAAALQMAPIEVEQLLKLAQLKRQGES